MHKWVILHIYFEFFLKFIFCLKWSLFGKKLQIRAGSVYYKSGGQIVPVAFYKEHEKFNSFLLTNDISLLKLSKKLNFNENVQPISIAKSIRSIKDGAMGTVSGWGDQTEDGWGSSRLLEVEIPLITFNKCKNYYGQKLFVTMFCAGYEEGGMDACQVTFNFYLNFCCYNFFLVFVK